jgi:maltose O-acetyltransferase
MTEKEKMIKGEYFNPLDPSLRKDFLKTKEKLRQFNQSLDIDTKERNVLLQSILGKSDSTTYIQPPFYCDYGYRIKVGKNFYANYNLTILDDGLVTIGDDCMIGPNVGLYTPTHPMAFDERKKGLEYGKPISIGHGVWIGGHVVINGGVSIGDHSVIGSGSVVTKDIPENVFAAGNPCRIIRKITD